MCYRTVWILALVLLLGMQWAPARSRGDTTPSRCPTLRMSGSDPSPDSPLLFNVAISGAPKATKPLCNWTVTAGKVINQGSCHASIDKTGLRRGQLVSATVVVYGLPGECLNTQSWEIPVLHPSRRAPRTTNRKRKSLAELLPHVGLYRT